MAQQWLSIVEYAREHNVSDMTVRRRIKTGKLNAVLKEGKYFIAATGSQVNLDIEPVKSETSSIYKEPIDRSHSHLSTLEARQVGGPAIVKRSHFVARDESSTMHDGRDPKRTPEFANATVPSSRPKHPEPMPRNLTHQQINNSNRRASQRQPAPSYRNVPSTLQEPLDGYETSLVDTRALLAFCDASLKKLSELERRQVEKFKAKLETLEATIANKDLENNQLMQKVEDLQLLIKVLEKKLKSEQ